MKYNDRSPLENMHCARLFEICGNEETDMFKRLDATSYKSARKVCVSVILHTDMAVHFELVRSISSCYELASEICENQARFPTTVTAQYRTDVLKKESLLWLEMFLHMSDVSNPVKPFK